MIAVHFLVLSVLFVAVYFGASLPAFQYVSRRWLGRRFVVRLGSPWRFGNPGHRWDVLLSFLSFAAALAVSMLLLDQLVTFGYLPASTREP